MTNLVSIEAVFSERKRIANTQTSKILELSCSNSLYLKYFPLEQNSSILDWTEQLSFVILGSDHLITVRWDNFAKELFGSKNADISSGSSGFYQFPQEYFFIFRIYRKKSYSNILEFSSARFLQLLRLNSNYTLNEAIAKSNASKNTRTSKMQYVNWIIIISINNKLSYKIKNFIY